MSTNINIDELLTKDDCYKIVQCSTNHPATITSYRLEKISDQVIGFLGEHFRLIINYTFNNNNNVINDKKDYFMKIRPQTNQSQLDYMKEMGVFERESFLYQHLLGDLLVISDKQFAPFCYHINPDKCIVLENLLNKNYKLVTNDYLDMNYGVSIMLTLARFHASTLIYEETNCVRLNEKFPILNESPTFTFIVGHPRQKWFDSSTNCLINCLKLMPEYNNNIEEICMKLRKFIYKQLPELSIPSQQYRNVLCHDDLWCNNLMFNQQLDCVMVDFQFGHYAPPAIDVLLTIFMNFQRTFIDDNFNKLIDIYYRKIVEELERYHLKSDLFPKRQFLESLQTYKLFSLIESTMFGTNTYISNELSDQIVSDFDNFKEFTFLNRSKFVTIEFKNNQQFRERIANLLTMIVEVLSQQ